MPQTPTDAAVALSIQERLYPNLPCFGYETLLDPLNSATYAVSGRSMHS